MVTVKKEYIMNRQGKECECGCGKSAPIAPRTASRFGWVKGEPVRFIRGHATRRNIPDYLVDPVTGCWNWNRGLNRRGYGDTGSGVAHRVMYERLVGPIPPGLELDHLCRNRACCNPTHLQPVTHAENVRRGSAGRHPKPHALQPDREHEVLASAASTRKLAALYGCSHEAIRQIRLRAAGEMQRAD